MPKTVPKELLDIICCPTDKGDLKYDKKKQTLACQICKTTYPVTENIPILLQK
ncbi:MAG TPA: Trm112 family protein [Candidatus Nanoarchaeia archaeon]|nr:Trm112 family protein [Candidatus Nanoarchaeia archaeon]